MDGKKWVECLCTRGKKVAHDAGVPRPGEDEEIDEEKARQGGEFFQRNLFSLLMCSFAGLYSLMYIKRIVRVLHLTNKSHTRDLAFRRYLGTLNHAMLWQQGPESLRASLKTVLKMHRFADKITTVPGEEPSMSQFDMAITQWAFIGPALLFPQYFGINDLRGMEGLSYIYYLVGKHLGIQEEFNLCADGAEKAREYSQAIQRYVVKPSMDSPDSRSSLMAVQLLRGVNLFNPFLVPEGFHLFVSRLINEEDLQKETGLSGESRLFYNTVGLFILGKVFHWVIAPPIRYAVNKLILLNLLLANEYADQIQSNSKIGKEVNLRARIEALINIYILTPVTLVRLLIRKIKSSLPQLC